MAYSLAWGSDHPGHLVYIVDLSQSMSRNDKIDNVIFVLGEVSEYLIGMCESFHSVKNRFSITILGYNTDIYELFSGSVLDLNKRLDDLGDKPMFDKSKEAAPRWQTYTAKAFRAAAKDIREWISEQNRSNVPTPVPIVIHITDGHPEENERGETEAVKDALQAAQDLKSISVADGSTLLFNIHIDGVKTTEALRFPDSRPTTDARRQFLFDASSTMPDVFSERANSFGFTTTRGSRFMVSNESNPHVLARLVAFGSSASSQGDTLKELPKM